MKLAKTTIFIGSFLAFALEPLIGRTLLPVFGGTPSVWLTCLVAFQLLMVGGYAYAGKVALRPHLCLLLLAAGWCTAVGAVKGLAFGTHLLTTLSGLTGVSVLDVIIAVVTVSGLTFILLSANSTIVQMLSDGNYRLYAVSNAGSLFGLFAYPFLFEPNLSLSAQWFVLGVGIFIYTALLGSLTRPCRCVAETRSGKSNATPQDGLNTDGLPRTRQLLYLLIPALTCAYLNATTAHLTLDVAPLPLLWVAILALFLISYIIGFSAKSERFASFWAVLAAVATAASVLCEDDGAHGLRYLGQLAITLTAFLAGCTYLHSVLYAMRPDESHLPRFYLLNVIGGALGGMLSTIVAPLVFTSVAEYPIALAVLAVAVACRSAAAPNGRFPLFRRILPSVLGLAVLGCLVYSIQKAVDPVSKEVYAARGFFGTVKVKSTRVKVGTHEGAINEFVHGNTIHGKQLRVPGKERMPTSYYTPYACGYAITGHRSYREGKPMRVNIVGLGIGVLFAYAREGDYYRAYDVSPEAIALATNVCYFSFVADSPARNDIVLCDARKGLEAELAAGVEPYDVIIVDAFSGDNVPFHLATKEAFELYFRLLKKDGILCVHLSNRNMNLDPLVRTVAETFNVPMMGLVSIEDMATLRASAKVAIFCRNTDVISPPPLAGDSARLIDFNRVKPMPFLPTDDKGSFVGLVNWL